MNCIIYCPRRPSTLITHCRPNASPIRSTATGRYVSSRGMVSTPEQLNQLVFCAAVFREVVRLRTAAPIIFHTCMVGTTVKHCLSWFKDSGFPTSRPKNRQTVYVSAVLETVNSVDQYRFVDGAYSFSTHSRRHQGYPLRSCFHAIKQEDHTTNKGFKIKKGWGVTLLTRFASISEENFTRGAEFIPER